MAQQLAQARHISRRHDRLRQVGEESGKLEVMLLHQADLDEQHVRHTIDRLLAILVPVLTIVLGIVVAGLIAPCWLQFSASTILPIQ